MRTTLLIAFLFGMVAKGQAAHAILPSVDHAKTFAYGEMIWHQLSADPVNHVLIARITFSDLPYADSHNPRVDEAFDFRFSGAYVDPKARTLFVRDRRGSEITIARFRGDPMNGWVDLTSGTKIFLLKESGRVTAILTATSEPRAGLRWIQLNDNWSLQNLLNRLFCAR